MHEKHGKYFETSSNPNGIVSVKGILTIVKDIFSASFVPSHLLRYLIFGRLLPNLDSSNDVKANKNSAKCKKNTKVYA